MSTYWVMDRDGLVIGPVTLAVLMDIAPQTRLNIDSKASRDGKTWMQIRDVPELARALLGPSEGDRKKRDLQEAQRLEMQLDRFRELRTHELFSVREGASAREHRPGYLALAKPYHPARLPRDVAPELLRASMALFQFLSTRIAQLEAEEKAGGGPKAAPTPTPSARPLMTHVAGGASALFQLKHPSGKPPEVHIHVRTSSLGLFCDHRVVNLSTNGLFVPSDELLHLGTVCSLFLAFMDPVKTLQTRAVVVVESTASGAQQTKGFGLRMEKVPAEDLAFIKDHVAALRDALPQSKGRR